MTETNTEAIEEKLPRRDLFLLPALSLLTILVLFSLTELAAYIFYSHSDAPIEETTIFDQPSKDLGGTPYAHGWEKISEGAPAEYRFNGSGYRSGTEFGPKSAGRFRVVVIGSSFVLGNRLSVENAFATRLAPELSRLTGKQVETLNLGMTGAIGIPTVVNQRFKYALETKPDLILRVVTPWDIQMQLPDAQQKEHITEAQTFLARIRKLTKILRKHNPGTGFMFQHLLYQSQSEYVRASLVSASQKKDYTEFLSTEYDARWEKYLQTFASNDALIQEEVKASGVPMVTVLIPTRAQVAMISMGEWPSGFSPYKLDQDLSSIVTSHGGAYIDILPEYRNIANPERGYFAIDGHPNAQGHAIIARLLAKELTSGAVTALETVKTQPSPKEQKK